jgi:hypothetical protein
VESAYSGNSKKETVHILEITQSLRRSFAPINRDPPKADKFPLRYNKQPVSSIQFDSQFGLLNQQVNGESYILRGVPEVPYDKQPVSSIQFGSQ